MSGSKVLIVEDNRWIAEQQSRVLEKAGFETIISPHARDAIDVIDDKKPDVIVMDMLLTGDTAFTLMHELQSYDDTKKMPIILCTNLAENIQLSDVEPYGVRRIMDKTTMHPDDIVVAVRSVL